MKKLALGVLILAIVMLAAISIVVQLEADYVVEDLGGSGPAKGLVLFHPVETLASATKSHWPFRKASKMLG